MAGRRLSAPLARLWAPWRLEYIKSAEGQTRCFLCDDAKKRHAESLVLHRGKKAFVILNKYPYNTGHLLVSPYRHKDDFDALTDAEVLEMMRLMGAAKRAIARAMGAHGFNVGVNLGRVAGAGLPGHIHLHVVPRWNGDTNFMPVVGETKVLPLTLLQTRDLLAKAWSGPR
jgi:ATP adenylyltransferase